MDSKLKRYDDSCKLHSTNSSNHKHRTKMKLDLHIHPFSVTIQFGIFDREKKNRFYSAHDAVTKIRWKQKVENENNFAKMCIFRMYCIIMCKENISSGTRNHRAYHQPPACSMHLPTLKCLCIVFN